MDIKEVNVILVTNPIKFLQTPEEYLTSFDDSGIFLFKKFQLLEFLLQSQALWTYVVEAFGALIRTPGDFLSFVLNVVYK